MEAFRLDQITESLVVQGFDPAEKLRWLEKSYQMPRAFFKALFSIYGKTHGYSAKTLPFKQYDFYYDIFEKQNNLETPAYVYYDSNVDRHEVTYGELQALVDINVKQWLLKGAVRGKIICIVRSLSLEYVVSVLSALKIGLIFSFLSPSRPYLIQKQIQALNPDYISTGKAWYGIVKAFHGIIIESMLPASKALRDDVLKRSCALSSGETVATLFDYTTEQLFEPVDISCDELYLNALRDGLIALDLRPGDVLAAPGYRFSDTQPAMMLSSLLTGATFLDIKPEICQRLPEVLLTEGITILGVTPGLRDLIQKKQLDVMTSCRFWFRSPALSTAYNEWHLFIKKTEIDHVLTGVLKWSSQAGGVLFFSRKRKGLSIDNVLPSAGLSWNLVPATQDGDQLSEDTGLLAISCHGREKITPWFVMKNMYEWLLLGSRFIEKKGKFYPFDLVHQFIQSTGICRYFFMTQRPSPVNADPCIHLIIFTGFDMEVKGADISDKICRRITLSMGREYCPDTIECFAMLPRLHPDGSMDDAWCRAQYADNRLTHKSRNGIFMGLSLIKTFILKKL